MPRTIIILILLALPLIMLAQIHPPIKGKLIVSSPYGQRTNPFDSGRSEMHGGIDLAAPTGTPVYAMLWGTVEAVGHDPRAGNYIKLRHGNFSVCYCHLAYKPNIAVGAQVQAGQPIGHVGTSGRATGPHLHLTIKHHNQVIDPGVVLRYLKLI